MDEILENRVVEEVQTNFKEEPISYNHNTYMWNDKLEQTAKDIGENCKGYKIMHINEAQKIKKTYNILIFLGIFIGPLSGLLSGINSIIYPDEDVTLPILSAILSISSGCILSIIKFGKYDETSIANKQAAARYTGIENSVRRQLGLYRKDRTPPEEYMKWLETKFEELFISAPILPTDAYSEYSKTANELGIKVPNQYLNTIKINNNYEDKTEQILINIDENNSSENKKPKSLSNEKIVVERSKDMAVFPELNQYSDKMLEYEIKRMMRAK